jgi:hypothetical protein
MDFGRRQPIWRQPVGCFGQNHAQKTMLEHQIIMLEIHRSKTINSGNPRINFTYHNHPQGIVTPLRSPNFRVLPSFPTRHQLNFTPSSQSIAGATKEYPGYGGHRGKHMTSPKEDMVDLKWSSLSHSEDMGHHHHAHLNCLQHTMETIQSFGRPHPLPLHQDNLLTHLVDPPLASQRNDFCRLWNSSRQMLAG